MDHPPQRVLFVCYANICRSPMAEAVFNTLAQHYGIADRVQASSAGIHVPVPGQPTSPGTAQMLAQHGIAYTTRSRQIDPQDLARYDYIFAADRRVLSTLLRYRGEHDAPVQLMLQHAHRLGWSETLEVADPYPDGDYFATYQSIYAACMAFFEHAGFFAAPNPQRVS
jgi:protein-tyrosine phosphatase